MFLLAMLYVVFNVAAKLRKGSDGSPFEEVMPELLPGIGNNAGFPGAPAGFDQVTFLAKVRKAFLEVQMAWSAQSTDMMRRFISDGVYQRFNTQFKMMRLLQQSNPLSDINISMVWVERIEQDGRYDIVHAGVKASMTDRFICALNHALDEEGTSEFVEYWSFIRKRGAAGKDIYDSEQCPNCGAPLPKDMGELCKCKYCNAMVNSGEFDWVLAEITQQEDYRRDGLHSEKMPDLEAKVTEMNSVYGDFSVQLVEDKASNAWMQMMTAKAMHNPAIMRRFVTDDLFRQLTPKYEQNKEIFNRIFLNRVTLIKAEQRDGKNILTFALTASIQRAVLTGNSVRLVDPEIVEHEEIMTLTRDVSAGAGKGSIYQHTCPACGAPVKDTLDIKCAFCGSTLNSTANDWVVSGLMDRR
ncbi:zinc-ribbon domain-containing transport protein [Chlorobaculum sp. MV4-Y]|uniref:zinc-ribbon domain-containing transport protein n=1 Tax=Chlorobaculum sp. MV4-Y TaxID=2976335 RepID=UPI0021B029C5|nr:zinc-ribbon domain-containing transport protein [Chlorobaculum sp. MV4-Y]UWX57304.1 zinc-ribbon domain-containing transport protein [Chlorobaculum sp. MV4-Y]